MILSVTPNPSLDATIELLGPLSPGQVHRAVSGHRGPGGKGVNVSRALAAAETETLALLPGDSGDALLTALETIELPHHTVPIGAPLRTNITITDPTGTTTKINEPGPRFKAETTSAFVNLVVEHAWKASWVALAGSLPPGAPESFYARLIHQIRRDDSLRKPLIAVDSSGAALVQAITAQPDLIKPNAEELLELHRNVHGVRSTAEETPETLEANVELAANLTVSLQPFGVRAALVTLGARGALFVPAAPNLDAPLLFAYGPSLAARSTVGAGDAALAGFLYAHQRGDSDADCLRQAVAHGRAAATLPGSAMPGPKDLSLVDVAVDEINTTMKGSPS